MGKKQITHVKQVASAGEGRHKISDTKGLYLIVKDSGTRSFGLSMTHRGIRHERGLGSYPAVGLREAKAKAFNDSGEWRELLAALYLSP